MQDCGPPDIGQASPVVVVVRLAVGGAPQSVKKEQQSLEKEKGVLGWLAGQVVAWIGGREDRKKQPKKARKKKRACARACVRACQICFLT